MTTQTKSLPLGSKVAQALLALSELYIVTVGQRGRSSGEVYALTMGAGVSLENHEAFVRSLFSAGILEPGLSRHWLQLSPLGADLLSAIMARHAVLGTEPAIGGAA